MLVHMCYLIKGSVTVTHEDITRKQGHLGDGKMCQKGSFLRHVLVFPKYLRPSAADDTSFRDLLLSADSFGRWITCLGKLSWWPLLDLLDNLCCIDGLAACKPSIQQLINLTLS
jgi:hypothetical protein